MGMGGEGEADGSIAHFHDVTWLGALAAEMLK